MCTYAILVGAHPSAPVIVAGNRDELLDRDAEPPGVLDTEHGIVGGRDVRGGTWLALRRDGRLALVTNHRTWSPADPSLRSRGVLPLELLAAKDTDAGLDVLRAVDARAYNPFHLVLADGAGAWVADSLPGERDVRVTPLGPGLHVVANVDFGAVDQPRIGRAHARAEAACAWARSASFDGLAEALRVAFGDHTPPQDALVPEPPPGSPVTRDFARRLEQVCVHVEAPVRYGTRSFAFVALEPGRVRAYRVADGPPCVTPLGTLDALAG